MRRACAFVLFSALALLPAITSVGVCAAQTDPPAADAEVVEVEPQSAQEPQGHLQGEESAPGEGEASTVEAPATEEAEPLAAEEAAAGGAVPPEADEETEWRPPRPEDEVDLGEADVEPAEDEALAAPVQVPVPVVSIEVVGNELVPEAEIRQAIGSEVGGPFSEGQVARDREAVRALGWFETVSVERESVEDGIRLVFRVTENPVVSDVQFEGVKVLAPDDLLAVMKTQAGQIYNAPRLLEDAHAIEQLYRSKGYILAMVLEPSMSPDGVLTLLIAEGEIEDIRITGNNHSKTYAIRRYMRTQPGEAYNDEKVARDVARLTALGWFETVRRAAEVGTEPGRVIVLITVVEKPRTGMVSVGGGYSSVQGLVGFIDLTKGNLGGNGQAVSIRGEFGGRSSYEFGYHHPWIATPETTLNLGVYDRRILREAFVTTPEEERLSILYDERRIGSSVMFGRPLSDTRRVFLGFRSDDVSISGVREEEEQYLTGPAFEPRKVRSVTLAAVSDTRRETYNPRGGAYQRLSAEFAGLIFGGTEFNKYVLDVRRFYPIGGNSTVAARLLVGTTTGDPPYLEQFLVGGGETLRGYRNDRFVGRNMAILNTEYRLPIGENLLGVLFVDVGDAWGHAPEIDSGTEEAVHESFKASVGYGVGVRVRTPIGPLRLDLGFSEEGTETHFGVRQTF